MSCRTGRDYQVPLPNAKNLVEISNSPLSINCSLEFRNFVMLAMEGQRTFRFEANYSQHEEIIEHKNVIFVELCKRLSAYEFSNIMSEYGDVYVVKDSVNGYFVEFQWVDDIKYPQCKRAQDIADQMKEDQIFGQIKVKNAHGVTMAKNVMAECMTYREALEHRASVRS